MIIGVTGTIGSGKGEFARILKEEHGFMHFSMGDLVRGEADKQGLEKTRDNLMALGRKMAAVNKDFWVETMMLKIEAHLPKNIIVEGFRGPYVLEKIRGKFGKSFILVGVDAPQEMRWKRLESRARPGDPSTYGEFLEVDGTDRGINGKESFFKTDECMKMADKHIQNDGSLEEFKNNILGILKEIKC
jgi:dephospho-CoA kinase